jgi:hypothetical protein
MTPRFITMALIALSLALLACNATGATQIPVTTAGPTVSTTVATAAEPLSAPAVLRGRWTANVQGTTAASGLWTMTISEGNVTLQNPVNGDLFSLGPTAISETKLVLAADPYCPDQSQATEGTYVLALSGTTLTITLVSDSCGDRSAVLVSAPWTKQP